MPPMRKLNRLLSRCERNLLRCTACSGGVEKIKHTCACFFGSTHSPGSSVLGTQESGRRRAREKPRAGHSGRRMQAPIWATPVLPPDDHADQQAQDAECVQNVPLVSEVPADVPLDLAPLPVYSSLTKEKPVFHVGRRKQETSRISFTSRPSVCLWFSA